MTETGKLILVPTPIGNMEDITYRAVRMLNESDLILAEDTRKTGLLLKKLDIRAKLQSYHAFNEHKVVSQIVTKVRQGLNIAMVTDAGTPAISDPGYLIVKTCIDNDIFVECLPGPTALIPALAASGI
ncbi:SAM-dependent methyltransferase, partial [Bacteroidota bacterium]